MSIKVQGSKQVLKKKPSVSALNFKVLIQYHPITDGPAKFDQNMATNKIIQKRMMQKLLFVILFLENVITVLHKRVQITSE